MLGRQKFVLLALSIAFCVAIALGSHLEEDTNTSEGEDPDAWMADLSSCGQIEAEGTYCNWGQNGHVDCIYHEKYWNFYSGGTNWTTCPEGTRCSCFKDVRCDMPRSEICKPLEVFPSWPDVFHVSFEKTFVYIWDIYMPRDSDAPRVVRGVTKQDKQQDRVFQQEDDTSMLIQKEDGGYVQYTWNNKNNEIECSRKNVNQLQPFMPNMKYYQFQKSTKAGNQQSIRTYYFQNGPLNNWALESFRYWWSVVHDAATDTILPMTYKYRYTDQEDKRSYDDFTYKVHEFGSGVNTEGWFTLPGHCQ